MKIQLTDLRLVWSKQNFPAALDNEAVRVKPYLYTEKANQNAQQLPVLMKPYLSMVFLSMVQQVRRYITKLYRNTRIIFSSKMSK